MKIKIVFTLIISMIFLSACTSSYEVNGEVFKKEHVPENTYMITMFINNSPVIMPQTNPEEWLITIGDREYDVTENIFNKIDIGDHVQGTLNGTDESNLTITKK